MKKQLKLELEIERTAGPLEATLGLAMRLGRQHLADYGHPKSRHDFTQTQLMACLVLRTLLKATYRNMLDTLRGHDQLRETLGLTGKLPHWTTLHKFAQRPKVLEVIEAIITRIGRAALTREQQQNGHANLAVDATGMETTTASAHYIDRSGQTREHWIKASVTIICGCLLPLGIVLGTGPGSDQTDAPLLFEKTLNIPPELTPKRIYADAGYDAEWFHDLLREQWEIESIIKPAQTKADGTCGGHWRSQMTEEHLKENEYGKRWHIESYFSALKRTMGSALAARTLRTQHLETALRILTYSLRRT